MKNPTLGHQCFEGGRRDPEPPRSLNRVDRPTPRLEDVFFCLLHASGVFGCLPVAAPALTESLQRLFEFVPHGVLLSLNLCWMRK